MRTLKRITALEEELRVRVVASLQANASRVFLTTQIVDALHWPPGLGDATADELSARSDQLIALYAREGIASAGTAAALYLAARDRCMDVSNHHRASPESEALRLLRALAGPSEGTG